MNRVLEQYSPEVHQSDFWTIPDAARDLGARSALDSVDSSIAMRLAGIVGAQIDKRYLEDLKTIDDGFGYQSDDAAADRYIAGLSRLFGGNAFNLVPVRSGLEVASKKVKNRINEAIGRSGIVAVMLEEKHTFDVDTAAWRDYLDSVELEDRPEFPGDIRRHPGKRIARVIECLDITDEHYYRFSVQGKSGTRYGLDPKSKSPKILATRGLTLPSTDPQVRSTWMKRSRSKSKI